MAGTVFLGALAAFGVLSVLWALLGWLLPDGKGTAVVCWGEPDDGILSRVKWLRSVGLLQSPLLIVAEDRGNCRQSDDMEYCSPGQLLSRLEQERKQFDGTGNGDSSGNHRRGGVPEL